MFLSAGMSDCTGRVSTPSALKSPSLCSTMGISAPLKGCFEELYLNNDIQYVLQITCYKYFFPKPLVCSSNDINLFFPWMYFRRCTSGVFRHTESWAQKWAGSPDRVAGVVLCSSALAPELFCLTQGSSVCFRGQRKNEWQKKSKKIKSIFHLGGKTMVGKFIHLTKFLSPSSLQHLFLSPFPLHVCREQQNDEIWNKNDLIDKFSRYYIVNTFSRIV